MLVNDFNEQYGFQNRLLTFHPSDDGKYYMLEKVENKFVLYDMNGKKIQKEVKMQKGSEYRHNMIIKETKNSYLLENNFNFDMNGWNWARMSLEYFVRKYNGRFYGNLIPDEYEEGISSNFFGQKVIPVCVFDSRNGKDHKGNPIVWHGDCENNPIYAKMIKNDPWVMFFNGNDDSSYYSHFRTCFQTVEVWEHARINNNKMPKIIELPRKEKHPEEYYQLQSDKELFLFHQN